MPAKKQKVVHANGAITKLEGEELQITDLSPPLLLNIFRALSREDRHRLPGVCKQWRDLVESKEADSLWEIMDIRGWLDTADINIRSMYSWFMKRPLAVKHLSIEVYCPGAFTPIIAILALIGRGLISLKLYSDEDQVCGDNAPWLAFTPNLVSLELEEVIDNDIATAEFPPGLTRLVLTSHTMGDPLKEVPQGLEKLKSLKSLGLSGHHEFDYSRLGGLTTIEELDLSNSGVTVLPPALQNLTALTSLTLNNCPELPRTPGGLSVLSELKALKRLEMRECDLGCLPIEIVELTALQTLLMGYNNFTESSDFFPPIHTGPYLENLVQLAISDTIQEPMSFQEAIILPLVKAKKLRKFRINRNWGLTLTTKGVEELLNDKPQFELLEYSEDMATDMDVEELKEKFPKVNFFFRD